VKKGASHNALEGKGDVRRGESAKRMGIAAADPRRSGAPKGGGDWNFRNRKALDAQNKKGSDNSWRRRQMLETLRRGRGDCHQQGFLFVTQKREREDRAAKGGKGE